LKQFHLKGMVFKSLALGSVPIKIKMLSEHQILMHYMSKICEAISISPFLNIRVSAFLILLVLASGLIYADDADIPSVGGEINIRLSTDIRTSEPGGMKRLGVTDAVLHHVAETLVAYKEDLSVGPALATSWEITEEGTLYTFRLKRDVVFHNGEHLTAKHVEWSWQRLLSEKREWRCKPFFDGTNSSSINILRVEATDTYEIEFELERANSLFLDRIADLSCFSAILHSSSLDSERNWRSPVGTGPYTFDAWEKGHYVTLKRFPQYHGEGVLNGYSGNKASYIETLNWIVVPELTIAKAALRTGQLDVVYGLPESEKSNLRGEKGVKVSTTQNSRIYCLLMQIHDPLLSNKKIRKAITHSIDYSKIASVLTEGLATYNPSLVPTVSSFHSAIHKKGYEYNPKLAHSLLEEAGYQGERISIQTDRADSHRFNLAILIHSMLREVGFNVHLSAIDSATRISNYRNRQFQLMTFSFSPRTNPALIYSTVIGRINSDPTFQWEDSKARNWISQAIRTTDIDKKMLLFERIHKRLIDEIPIIVFFNGVSVDATSMRVEGYEPSVLSHPRFFRVWLSDR